MGTYVKLLRTAIAGGADVNDVLLSQSAQAVVEIEEHFRTLNPRPLAWQVRRG